jgi:hypothetical protein
LLRNFVKILPNPIPEPSSHAQPRHSLPSKFSFPQIRMYIFTQNPTTVRCNTFLPFSKSSEFIIISMASLFFLSLLSLILFLSLSSATNVPLAIHQACKATRFPISCETLFEFDTFQTRALLQTHLSPAHPVCHLGLLRKPPHRPIHDQVHPGLLRLIGTRTEPLPPRTYCLDIDPP